MLLIDVLQVPLLPGWQQGRENLESLEVPFRGQLIFEIHVKLL